MQCFCCIILPVNVDEWMKSANSLSPNDMEAGEFFVDAFIAFSTIIKNMDCW